MSAPLDRVKNIVRIGYQGAEAPFEGSEMKSVNRFNQTKNQIIRNLKSHRPLKLAIGVGLGSLLLTGAVAFQFSNTGAIAAVDSAMNSEVSSPSVNPVRLSREAARLDDQIDMMRIAAVAEPSVNPVRLSREVARLDDQIDMMRLNAIYKAFEVESGISQEIEQIEQQIDVELLVAAQDPRANLQRVNWGTERLDHKIETIRQAQAQIALETETETSRVIGYLEQRIDALLAASRT